MQDKYTTKVEAFKNEMRNYNFYQNKIKEIDDELYVKWYELSGVKGVRFDREPSKSFNEHLAEGRRLSLVDDISKLEQQRSRVEINYNHLNDVLKQLEPSVANYIKCIYADKEKFENVARKNNMSVGSLQYQIDSELRKAL